MKKRRSQNSLIISSSYLGVDERILKIYSTMAKYYKAEIIHLGPTVTDKEFNDYNKLNNEWTNTEQQWKSAGEAKQEERLEEKLQEIEGKIEHVLKAESKRINLLSKYFKKLTLVTTDKTSLLCGDDLDEDMFSVKYGTIKLSKYLSLSPVLPGSPRAVQNPFSSIAHSYLKSTGINWIVAHPVPKIGCFPRPGLNQAFNYYTVGSLAVPEYPKTSKEQYQFGHMPCAIMVLVDPVTGEFHPKQLHIDYLKQKNKTVLMVLDDGLVFLENGKTIEVCSENKGVFYTDDHAPLTHPGVVGCQRALNELHEPATCVNGGDAGDFISVNRHERDMLGLREGRRLLNDLNDLRKLLDSQSEYPTIKHKILLDSNHHEWVTNFVMQNPETIGILDWPTLATDSFSDWDLYIREEGENKIYWFGDYALRHGDKDGGVIKAESMFKAGKYLCGHWHKLIAFRRAIQTGCGSKLGPFYLGNEINAWQNFINSLTRYRGIASVNPKIVLHDKKRAVSRFAYRNSIYETLHYYL